MANQQIDKIEDINEAINPITPPIDGQEGLEILGHNRNQSVIFSRFSRSFFKIYSHLIALYSSIKNLKNVTITAGKGLTGGGNLSANRTINISNADGSLVIGDDDIKVNIYNDVDSTSTNQAASPASVKKANDNANERVLKSGDTMTGNLTVPNIELRGSVTAFLDFTQGGSNINFHHRIISEGDTLKFAGVQGYRKYTFDGETSAVKFLGPLQGNADTATKLATSRNIGGIPFDGTTDITLPGVNSVGNQSTSGNAATATKLAVQRNITVGNTTKAFDGGSNISYSLGEIGAFPATGGAVSGNINIEHGDPFISFKSSETATSYIGAQGEAPNALYYRIPGAEGFRAKIYHERNKPSYSDTGALRGWTEISDTTFDFNTIQESGLYCSSGDGITDSWKNAPLTGGRGWTWLVIRQLSNRVLQVAWTQDRMYSRYQIINAGTPQWTAWKKYTYSGGSTATRLFNGASQLGQNGWKDTGITINKSIAFLQLRISSHGTDAIGFSTSTISTDILRSADFVSVPPETTTQKGAAFEAFRFKITNDKLQSYTGGGGSIADNYLLEVWGVEL
ncbi:MAG: pyocin knob domain-containing protein [Cetobacterium sp.]|uniref:pyocin knob domain-containing protein n=1 Tax=Cetobacterium sp. TaxID=2071632 RepID=UPI003EE78311